MKTLLAICFILMFPALLLAESGTYVVRIFEPADYDALWEMGFEYLADLGGVCLIQGDSRALGRLEGAGLEHDVVARVEPGMGVYLVRPEAAGRAAAHSVYLSEVERGAYVLTLDRAALETAGPHGVDILRLRGNRFPSREPSMPSPATLTVHPRPEVQSLVDSVSGDTLWKYISCLSGNEPVTIGGTPDTILTRYTWSPEVAEAAEYLYGRFADYGYDVEYQEFTMGRWLFHGLEAVDAGHAWVVGERERAFATSDGGATWEERMSGPQTAHLYDASFVDTQVGWVVGNSGRVYATSDAGTTWTQQTVPVSYANLLTVDFVDPLRGWIGATGGRIFSTADAGSTWTLETTPTTAYIYDIDMVDATWGWACGAWGTILYWDGVMWDGVVSGTGENLNGVDFVSDEVGWVVGSNRTVLKTTDMGLSWVPQTVPPEAGADLQDIAAIDSSEAYIVGHPGSLLRTTDGGATWEIIDIGGLIDLSAIDFAGSQAGWITGDWSTILHTADGGTSWENQTPGLPPEAWTLQKNVVATKQGATAHTEEVLICGHYDSISNVPMVRAPGADDNASGVAAVLEAARLTVNADFDRTVRYICFSAEEVGLVGSNFYAAEAAASGHDIIGVLDFDMIGYVSSPPGDLDFVCDDQSVWLVDFARDCGDTYVPGLGTTKHRDPTYVYSDHAPFWWAGYPAFYALDDKPIINPYYHSTGDTLGTLTQAFTTDCVRLAVATLAELAMPDTAAGVPAPDVGPLAMSASPNPARRGTTISFCAAAGDIPEVVIYDIRGRLVRNLAGAREREKGAAAPVYETAWDGTDSAGHRVPPGVYFARVQAGSLDGSLKLVVLE